MFEDNAEHAAPLEGTKRRWAVWRVAREKYERLFHKKREGLRINFAEYRSGGENVFSSSTRVPSRADVLTFCGEGYFIIEHLFDGTPGDHTFVVIEPEQQRYGASQQSSLSGDDTFPRHGSRHSSRREVRAATTRFRSEQREAARRERERAESQSATAALLATMERERAATERERAREREAMQKERDRDREHEQQIAEIRLQQAKAEAETRIRQAELEARVAALSQQPDPKTLLVTEVMNRSGVIDELMDTVSNVRSRIDGGDDTPWYGRIIDKGVDFITDNAGDVFTNVLTNLATNVMSKRQAAQQQPAAQQHGMYPNGMHPQSTTQQPAQPQGMSAPAASAPPSEPTQPQNYEEAVKVVSETIVNAMDRGAKVRGVARDIMELVRQYPQESQQLLTLFQQPSAILLKAWSMSAPELKEIFSREGSAEWLDELKAEVARRLARRAEDVQVEAAQMQAPTAASMSSNGTGAHIAEQVQ